MIEPEVELASLVKRVGELMNDAYNDSKDRTFMQKEALQGIFDKLQLLPMVVAGKFASEGRWQDAYAVSELADSASQHVAILLKLSALFDSVDKIKSSGEDDVSTIADLLKLAQPEKKKIPGPGGIN